MSCNGCRVLRKACSDDCVIRPCLQWIKAADSQANATFFLAKFYGRAGLINLINAGTENLRPALFRSLLYEACGRIVNPVYGSIGLLWFDNWNLCEMAVEAVLKGMDVANISTEFSTKPVSGPPPTLRDYETGRLYKAVDLNGVSTSRSRVKRTTIGVGTTPEAQGHRSCLFSWEIGESSHVSQAESGMAAKAEEAEMEMDLNLSLGSKLGHSGRQ